MTQFSVQHSVDGSTWDDVEGEDAGGAIFLSSSGNVDALFVMPVTAQYIRITVLAWNMLPSMRAGLLVTPAVALIKQAEVLKKEAVAICDTPESYRSVLDPPEINRTYSSIYSNSAIGTSHARSMLSSPQAWSASSAATVIWMQINAESAMPVFGVRIKARANSYTDQYVSSITVQHSADGSTWSNVDGGATFTGASGNFDALFATPVVAQHIRVTVGDWSSHPSMRAGLLVTSTEEARLAPSFFVTRHAISGTPSPGETRRGNIWGQGFDSQDKAFAKFAEYDGGPLATGVWNKQVTELKYYGYRGDGLPDQMKVWVREELNA